MGVALIDPNKAYKYRAVAFDAEVSDGLQGLWFLNTDTDNAAYNFATQRRNKIVGSPEGYPAQIRFHGGTDYFETDVSETRNMTVMAIARSRDSMVDEEHRPAYVSNFSSASENPSVTGYGYSLWPLDADSMISAAGRYTNAGSTTASSGGVQINGPDTGEWAFYCSRVSDTQNVLNDLTRGVSAQFTTYPYPRYRAQGKLRIGSGYNFNYRGHCDMAFLAVWNRVLTDAERDAMYTQVQRIQDDLFGLHI